jgi:hypothetical protein
MRSEEASTERSILRVQEISARGPLHQGPRRNLAPLERGLALRAQPPEPRTPLIALAEELGHARSLLFEERRRNKRLRYKLDRLETRAAYWKNLCIGYEIELGVRPAERKSKQVEQEAA